MKTSRFSESQIIAILRQPELATPVPWLCRERPGRFPQAKCTGVTTLGQSACNALESALFAVTYGAAL